MQGVRLQFWTHHECSGQVARAVRQWTRTLAVSCECYLSRNSYRKELALGLFPQRQASSSANDQRHAIGGCLRPAEAHFELGLPSLLLRAATSLADLVKNTGEIEHMVAEHQCHHDQISPQNTK